MIKTTQFNNLPDKILERIPKYPMNKVVSFRLTGIRNNPLNGSPVLPAAKNIPSRDSVYDPDTGMAYDIANVISVGIDNTPSLGDIWFRKERAATITCNLAIPAQRHLYEYLSLSNYNESNPHRDKSVPALFYFVDDPRNVEKDMEADTELGEALHKASSLTHGDLKKFAAIEGLDMSDDIKILRRHAQRLAKNNPKRFERVLEALSTEGEEVEMVRAAMNQKVIKLNRRTWKWSWSDTNDVFFAGQKGLGVGGNVSKLADWLRTHKDGEPIKNILEGLINTEAES